LIKIYNKSLELLAELENAYDKELEREANNIAFFSFSLPLNDPKNKHCQHFNFVEVESKTGRKYGKYRILPTETKKKDNSIRYSCEHVISTLWDDVLDTDDTNGYVQFTNMNVRYVIETLLSFQTSRHWVLGRCDFADFIESYGFENENNLFNPVFSIPEPLGVPYEFTYNTDVYPFQLNLVEASNEVKAEYQWGKDILEFNKQVDPSGIVNYLIPKGYGEGVNMLTIKEANNGKKFLKDDASIAKWGRRSDIRIDRRFKYPAALKAWGENLLSELKDPKFSIEVKAADLSVLPGHEHERRILNSVANVIVGDDTYQVRIIKETIKDLDREHLVDYELGNEIGNIAKTNADQKKRQDVQERYSNGNTTLDSISVSDNCDENYPLIFRLWIPDDVLNVNTMDLTYETVNFRAFTKGSESGGGTLLSTTSSSGGGQTTSSGGGQTTSAGGGQTTSAGGGQTSSSGGDHRHKMFTATGFQTASNPNSSVVLRAASGNTIFVDSDTAAGVEYYTEGSSGTHSHTVSDHVHSVSDHTHTVQSHTHTVQNHTHDIEIEVEPHTHPQIYGVYEAPNTPSLLIISIEGTVVPITELSGENIDIIPYLPKDEGGRIERNRWVTIEMSPDTLAKINASVVMRYFISSQVGGVF
jgi:phage minor structural protein